MYDFGAFRLVEYDDILDELEVYSFVALAAYYAKNWGACSKAFIRYPPFEPHCHGLGYI